MNDTKYNGWTNYATWRVNLEIFDGVGANWVDQLPEDLYDAAQYLKEMAEEFVVGPIPEGFAHDYALAFLEDVNWREIAQHMIADYADETN